MCMLSNLYHQHEFEHADLLCLRLFMHKLKYLHNRIYIYIYIYNHPFVLAPKKEQYTNLRIPYTIVKLDVIISLSQLLIALET